MTLTVEVPPEVETALEMQASQRGMTPAQYAGEVLGEWLLDIAQDKEDAEDARHILTTSDLSKRHTLAELRQALGRRA